MKDSRQINQKDRENILKTIEESPHQRIIITHGTYTIPDTARYLKANLKREDQVIILTSSLIPLIGFSPSDAPFHLGYAIARSTVLSLKVNLPLSSNIRNNFHILFDKFARGDYFINPSVLLGQGCRF